MAAGCWAVLLPLCVAGKLPSVREDQQLNIAAAMRCGIPASWTMGKRRKKQTPFIHPMFLERSMKPVELPKPEDPCHDEGFERALIEWIVAHRQMWRKRQKSGEP